MNHIYIIAVSALTLLLLGSRATENGVNTDPIPAGCEATPLTLNTTITETEPSGFNAIDEFNISAKNFRAKALEIADKALKLTVTMCQVNDPEIGEYTHRECFTGLDLARTDDCKGKVMLEGKAAFLLKLGTIIADGTETLALGADLVVQAAGVSKSTIDEVKGNRLKLVSANKAVKNLDETKSEINNSMEALKSAIKYAQGSKAAIESWELQ